MLNLPSLKSGAVFADRYEVREAVGSGGSGEVFRAFDRVARTEVALKILFPGCEDRDLERLRREARLLRSLHHPGIVRLYDIGECDGLHYTVSELLAGESLARRIRRDGPMSPEVAERFVCEVFDALAAAHDAGIVHRDVKPANIFLVPRKGGSEQVVLLDFSFARREGDPRITRTGRFVGTPHYSSPEQIRGEREPTAASDLYSCGVTLWEMLAGVPPFVGASEWEVLNAHLVQPPPPVAEALPETPARIRELVLRLLEKDPRDRPASAREALEILGRRSFRARLAGLGRGWSRSFRRRAPFAIAATVAGVAVAAALCTWLLTPVSVAPEGRRVAWRTRSGIVLRSRDLERPVARAVLVNAGWPARGTAVVSTAPPDPAGERSPEDAAPIFLEIDFLGGRARPVVSGNTERAWMGDSVYPHESPNSFVPASLVAAGRSHSGHPIVAASLSHSLDYPARVVTFEIPGAALLSYVHPGHVYDLECYTQRGGGAPRIVALAVNNLLGPRAALLALPADLAVQGQGPPYTGPARLPERALWYVPLPYGADLDARLTLAGDRATVGFKDGRVFVVDLENGVPVDATLRGGLDPTAWQARRDALLAALAQAAGLAEAGDAVSAAERLEAFARAPGTPGALASIPLYRAAIHRLRSTPEQGPSALELARADLEAALRAEPDPAPARIALLHAEVLARLGRREPAWAALRAWWSMPRPDMYSLEWLFASWLAGQDPRVDLATDGSGAIHAFNWSALAQMVHAYRHGEFESAIDVVNTARARFESWDQHLWWAARAALDRPSPDPRSALDFAVRSGRAMQSGVAVPWRLAALRARLETDRRAAVDDGSFDAAVEDLHQVAVEASSKLEPLMMLPGAVEDAERVLMLRPGTSGFEGPLGEARAVLAANGPFRVRLHRTDPSRVPPGD